MGEKAAVEVMDSSSPEHTGSDISNGPVAKRVALGHATALAGLTLQLVMQFAGNNEGIFIANVCSNWKNSFISTFKDKIRTHEDCADGAAYSFCTHRAACMVSLQRVHWVWSGWCCRYTSDTSINTNSASLYLGSYGPRLVVQAAILDETLAVDSEWLLRGIARSGREILLEVLWKAYKSTKASAKPAELEFTLCRIADDAAESGNLRVFALVWNYLIEDHGERAVFQCGESALFASAQKGYIHILEFLSLTDWWTTDSGPTNCCNIAAIYNQCEVLSWLRAHGFALDARTARAAASNAETTTLDFLLENGCPGMDRAFVSCCVQHNPDALQWCYDTLRPRLPHIWTAASLRRWLLLAGTFDRENSAKFLLEHGAEWPDIGQTFGKDIACHDDEDYNYDATTTKCIWSPSFLEWAMAEGCTFGTWSTGTCARLIKETDWTEEPRYRQLLKMSAWAHSHNCPCRCPRDKPDF